jgi:type IV secretory pathway VirB10-like protein
MADELNPNEIGESIHGGGRFNLLLLGSAIIVAMIVGVVLIRSLFARGTASPTATKALDEDDEARDKARIRELESYATIPPARPPVFHFRQLMLRQQRSTATLTPRVQRQPSPFEQWKQQEFLRAHMVPPLVKGFQDKSTLELAQAGDNGASAGLPHSAMLHPAASPYTVMAGSVIPAVLINGINSDLPGPVIAQVSENVFDSATGKSLLVPQGSKLIGAYSNAILYGQQRVRVEFQRLIFPDTSSMDLPHAVGADEAGYAGMTDEVNNHYLKTFGTAAVMALISAGQAVGQIAAFNNGNSGYGPYGYSNQWELATQSAGVGASSELGGVGQQVASRGLNRAPTLTLRPGFMLNVILTSDLVFPGPFKGAQADE